MKFGVLQFPGSCDEVDALSACERVGDARLIWHRYSSLGDVDAVAQQDGAPGRGLAVLVVVRPPAADR